MRHDWFIHPKFAPLVTCKSCGIVKNDRNAKGHLGSYLVQKAETTVSLAKSETMPGASDIVPEYTRNKEFPSMSMTITGYDTIELELLELSEPVSERVWTPDDQRRLLPLIMGKTPADATKFIRDTEGVPKRSAEKLLNEMEANSTVVIVKRGRSKIITQNDII